MLGLTAGTNFTKLSLHELSGRGRQPQVTTVTTPGMTTRDVPMPLVRNLMALHESAAPGSVKGFAKSIFKVGLMDELLSDAIESRSPSKRVDMKNPERVMEAFYAASFLQNEESSECLVYSQEGRVVGMAQVGKFGQAAPGLECTISNLVVSPKLDVSSQRAVIQHVANMAKTRMGEATLLTPEPWGAAYTTHGFSVESVQTSSESEMRRHDPLSASLMREAGVTPARAAEKANVVRCRWSG